MTDQIPDRCVMLAAAVAMVAGLAVTTLLRSTAPERIGWETLLPAWAVLGMAYAGLVTPGGRLLRRSAQTADLPSLFAAQFSLSHVCWLIAYPLAGWVGATLGLGAALVALSALALVGLLAAWRAWPKHDRQVVPHDHGDLAADHPHWKAPAADDAATGHEHAPRRSCHCNRR